MTSLNRKLFLMILATSLNSVGIIVLAIAVMLK